MIQDPAKEERRGPRSGAGQYFPPSPLIRAMVECVRPELDPYDFLTNECSFKDRHRHEELLEYKTFDSKEIDDDQAAGSSFPEIGDTDGSGRLNLKRVRAPHWYTMRPLVRALPIHPAIRPESKARYHGWSHNRHDSPRVQPSEAPEGRSGPEAMGDVVANGRLPSTRQAASALACLYDVPASCHTSAQC